MACENCSKHSHEPLKRPDACIYPKGHCRLHGCRCCPNVSICKFAVAYEPCACEQEHSHEPQAQQGERHAIQKKISDLNAFLQSLGVDPAKVSSDKIIENLTFSVAGLQSLKKMFIDDGWPQFAEACDKLLTACNYNDEQLEAVCLNFSTKMSDLSGKSQQKPSKYLGNAPQQVVAITRSNRLI